MTQRLFIVVVDDDPSVCKALGRLLRTAQIDVQTFESGETYLRALNDREPDCLVIDIRMPSMSGLELRERLLDDGYDVPIVFITAHAEDLVTERLVRTAGIEILRKPFDAKLFLESIQRTIKRHKSP